MKLAALCAVVLVLCFNACLVDGARMLCETSECPEDHCCLTVGEDSVCTKLQTLDQECQPDGYQSTTDNPEDQHRITYLGTCPCAPSLICKKARSSSEDSDTSASTGNSGVCQTAEPETAEEPAE